MKTKPLNERERQCASVAADLLLKGSPVTRIAKYCTEQRMTKEQIRTFCLKLEEHCGVYLTGDIMHAVQGMEQGLPDLSQHFGKILKHSLKNS